MAKTNYEKIMSLGMINETLTKELAEAKAENVAEYNKGHFDALHEMDDKFSSVMPNAQYSAKEIRKTIENISTPTTETKE